LSSSISLTTAVTSGDEKAVSSLIAKGADVNETTSGGQTALILAVIFGHTKLVKLLVKAGADPQLRDNLGLNAIEWAKRRGSREALEILVGAPEIDVGRVVKTPATEAPAVAPPPPTTPEAEVKDKAGDAEKSRRWLTGLRQRLDEQEVRRKEPPPIEPIKPPEPVMTSEPVVAKTEVTAEVPPVPPSGTRKRCPKCNEIYNGDLVFYCAHHVVPLVDADEPIFTEPPKSNTPLFWAMVVITLSGSIVIGSLITAYVYNSNQADARTATAQATIQKGTPEVGGDLVGKAVSLPDAECPVSGPDPVVGTVTVDVKVDRKGEVYWARGSGGDWLMRGASTEAAMKSTFSPEKLHGREAAGTITYTFKP
jgi:hypothetical protein